MKSSPPTMRSTTVTLAWDIWLRNRTTIGTVIGIVVFSCVLNSVLPDTADLLDFYLSTATLLLVLSIFSYTEFNPQRGTSGFPHRLFVLPVTTFKLVAIPMVLGVAALEVLIVVWTAVVIRPEDRSIWIPFQLGVFMVLYQTVLWTLPSLKSIRILLIGLIGVFTLMLRAFPFMQRLPDIPAMSLLGGVALTAFLISWVYVARERSGAGWTGSRVSNLAATVSDRIPRRRKTVFSSPQAAQFWFEWRRWGSILPLLVSALLVFVMGPLSWWWRNDDESSQRILLAALAMPMILALAVGKAVSKPDFWSKELTIPGFIAVRPLAAADIVAAKIKVAGVSTAVTWLLVLAFFSLWLPLWANLDSLAMVRGSMWFFHGHSVYPQYAIAALLVVASVLLTWRFLVGGLWLGLSGNTRVFAFSAFPYVFVPLVGMPVLIIVEQPVLSWIRDNIGRWLPAVVWIAAAAAVTKLWFAAFSWRKINREYARQYLPLWLGGTVCLIALAFLLGDLLASIFALDAYRVRNLMILIALQIVPLARLGLAPSFLDRNRHR